MFYKIVLALIFILCSTSFSQTFYETIITPVSGDEGDSFGWPVKLKYSYLYIGKPSDDNPYSNEGSVYIFENEKNSWIFSRKLSNPSNTLDAHFGGAIIVDDSVLVVAAGNDTANGLSSGVVYVYKSLGSDLVVSQKLYPLEGNVSANFGTSVAMNNNLMLIGAPEDFGIVPFSGAAYLFEKIGSEWVQKAKIIGEDALRLYVFGNSVAISGNYLFIGAPQANDLGSNSGAVYLYEIKNDSVHFVNKIIGSTVTAEYVFGNEISADSNRVAIGAEGSIFAQNYPGSVYIFELDGNLWIEKNQIIPDDPSAYHFGSSIKLRGDSILVGASGSSGADGSGKGYFYIKDRTEWKQVQSFQASDGTNSNAFGRTCELNDEFVIFGAPHQDVFGSNSGAVYVYSEHPTGIDDHNPPVLEDFILYQNYPNPFNPTTKIKFTIPTIERIGNSLHNVQLKVYDVLGTEIATLVNEEKPPGSYEVEFSARGGSASGGDAYTLPSGIYIYRLTVGSPSTNTPAGSHGSGQSFTSAKKLILLK